MKKIRKLKDDFKNQDLKGKIRIVFWSCLALCGIAIILVGVWLFMSFYGNRPSEKKVEEQESKNTNCQIYPISSAYCLLEYNNYNNIWGQEDRYRIARSAGNEELGGFFSSFKYVDLAGDSLIITKGEKGYSLFSLRTETFSDCYDYIGNPDAKHHLCACYQKGRLGFVDCHTGKLAIPMKFSAREINMVQTYYQTCYDDSRENDDGFGFKGDYCIVPTTCFTMGVIDYTGKILLDGYDEIEYFAKDTLFMTYKNDRYSLFDARNMKPLSVNQKRITVLPIGIVHSESGVLTSPSCADTLTDLIFEDYYNPRLYKFLSDHDLMAVHYDNKYVYDETGIEVERVFKGDRTYYTSGDREWGDDVGGGVEEGKTGRPVIEPQWDYITIYKNAKKNKYVFCCELGGYTFLLKENGDYVSLNNINF